MRIFLQGATPAFDVGQTGSLAERLERTGGNSGNQVIAFGLLNTLRYDEVSWDHRLSPEAVNERFDHCVIAAANFLYQGFDFGYLADFVEALRIPVSIAGLGAQSSDFGSDVTLPDGTERLLRVLADRCRLIGVRGDYTAGVLARRGIANVQVIGCPSFYADLGHPLPERLPPWRDGAMRLAVNASRDVIGHAFDPEAMRSAVTRLMRLALDADAPFVAQTERAEMVIAEGWIADLEPFVAELRHLFGAGVEPARFEAWARGGMRVYWDVPAWVEAMRGRDFVIGTRFHGAIAARMAGTPHLVVCHDTRTTEMCRFLGVPHCDLATFNDVSVEALYGDIDLADARATAAGRSRAYRDFLLANALLPQGAG